MDLKFKFIVTVDPPLKSTDAEPVSADHFGSTQDYALLEFSVMEKREFSLLEWTDKLIENEGSTEEDMPEATKQSYCCVDPLF